MAYSADTFTSLEQPTLAKWNKLWDNDAFFNSQIGTNFSSGTTSKVWWEELGRTTLGVAGDTITINPVAARKYLRIIVSVKNTGGAIAPGLRFNNDSATNYAYQSSFSGAAWAATTSATFMGIQPTNASEAYPAFCDIYVLNTSTDFKVIQVMSTDAFGANATTSVNFSEFRGKWASTSQVTRVDVFNGGAGDFAIGSEVVVLGHD